MPRATKRRSRARNAWVFLSPDRTATNAGATEILRYPQIYVDLIARREAQSEPADSTVLIIGPGLLGGKSSPQLFELVMTLPNAKIQVVEKDAESHACIKARKYAEGLSYDIYAQLFCTAQLRDFAKPFQRAVKEYFDSKLERRLALLDVDVEQQDAKDIPWRPGTFFVIVATISATYAVNAMQGQLRYCVAMIRALQVGGCAYLDKPLAQLVALALKKAEITDRAYDIAELPKIQTAHGFLPWTHSGKCIEVPPIWRIEKRENF